MPTADLKPLRISTPGPCREEAPGWWLEWQASEHWPGEVESYVHVCSNVYGSGALHTYVAIEGSGPHTLGVFPIPVPEPCGTWLLLAGVVLLALLSERRMRRGR